MANIGPTLSKYTGAAELSSLLESDKFGIVSVKTYGAKGDGVNNDTMAIQNAIDALMQAGGGIVFFPEGEYKVSNTIYVTSNITLTGCGSATKITPINPATNFSDGLRIFYAIRDLHPRDSKYNGPHTNIVIRNMEIHGPIDASRPRAGSVVSISRTNHVLIENLVIKGASDGCIRVDGYGAGTFVDDPTSPFWGNSQDVTIRNNECSDGFIGVELEGGVKKSIVEGNRFYDCTRVIRFASAYDSIVVNNKVFRLNGVAGLFDGGCGMNLGRSNNIQVLNNYFDVSPTNPLEISEPPYQAISFSISSVNNIYIENNVFENGYIGDEPQSTPGEMTGKPDNVIYVTNNIFNTTSTTAYNGLHSIIFVEARGVYVSGNHTPNASIYVRDNTTGYVKDNVASSLGSNSDYSINSNTKVYYDNNQSKTQIPLGPVRVHQIIKHEQVVTGNDYVVQEFSIPNTSSFTQIECEIITTRGSIGGIAKSKLEKATFFVGRLVNTDVVIDDVVALKVNEESTTAGGATTPPTINTRLLRTGVEASTATQVIAIKIDFGASNFSYISKISVMSTVNLETLV